MSRAGLPEPMLPRLAIIGAGRAGREFARRCIQAGYRVVLEDVMPANLRRAETEIAEEDSPLAGSLELVRSVEDAVRQADVAIDFVPDELESKLEIFCMLDRMAPPRTLLVTPSDALSIADLASCTYRPHQCFAVRGLRSGSEPGTRVTLARPKLADPSAEQVVRNLLLRLGLLHQTVLDEIPSFLTGR